MDVFRRSLVVLCLLLGACDSPVGLSGVWSGQLPGGTSFYFTLTETPQGVISGGGRINNTLVVFPTTVTGAHAHPAVTLAISPQGVQAMNFSGVLDPTLSQMNGVVFGSGFTGDSLRL